LVPLTQAPKALIPAIALQRRHIPGQIHPLQPRPGLCLCQQGGNIECAMGAMRNHRIGRTLQSDQAGQRAGIDARKPDPAIRRHPVAEMLGGAEIGRVGHILAHYRTQGVRVGRLYILRIGADIADMREGEIDDLPGIAGVGHHLLIAGHRGVEADFADRAAFCTKAPAPDHLSTGQNQYACRSCGRARSGRVSHGGGPFSIEFLAMSLRHRA
jgi:hypothetical protein